MGNLEITTLPASVALTGLAEEIKAVGEAQQILSPKQASSLLDRTIILDTKGRNTVARSQVVFNSQSTLEVSSYIHQELPFLRVTPIDIDMQMTMLIGNKDDKLVLERPLDILPKGNEKYFTLVNAKERTRKSLKDPDTSLAWTVYKGLIDHGVVIEPEDIHLEVVQEGLKVRI